MREHSCCVLWLLSALTFPFCSSASHILLWPHLLFCFLLQLRARLDDKTLMLFFICPPFSLGIHLEEWKKAKTNQYAAMCCAECCVHTNQNCPLIFYFCRKRGQWVFAPHSTELLDLSTLPHTNLQYLSSVTVTPPLSTRCCASQLTSHHSHCCPSASTGTILPHPS